MIIKDSRLTFELKQVGSEISFTMSDNDQNGHINATLTFREAQRVKNFLCQAMGDIKKNFPTELEKVTDSHINAILPVIGAVDAPNAFFLPADPAPEPAPEAEQKKCPECGAPETAPAEKPEHPMDAINAEEKEPV